MSAELLTSKSSAHSFWLLVGLSVAMMVVQAIFTELLRLKSYLEGEKTTRNWIPWVVILAQSMMGG